MDFNKNFVLKCIFLSTVIGPTNLLYGLYDNFFFSNFSSPFKRIVSSIYLVEYKDERSIFTPGIVTLSLFRKLDTILPGLK